MLFNMFPYVNYKDLNLDWIIKAIKEVEQEMEDFKVVNSIRFEGEFNIAKSYPKYSLVNQDGNGYISIKPVPAGVALDNEDYWRLVANYSELFADFQNRLVAVEETTDRVEASVTAMEGTVQGLDGRVSDVEERVEVLEDSSEKLILIGDSYGVNSSAGGKSWASHILDEYPNAISLMEGGTGFGSDVYTTKNWLSMLQNATIPDKNAITQIIVIGGANDANLIYDGRLTSSILRTRMDSFCDYCATEFPNAKVKIAFVGWYRTNSKFASYNATRDIYLERTSIHKNASYYSAGEPIMHNNAFINTSDLIHPTAGASKCLGEFADSVINDSQYTFKYSTDVTITVKSPVTAIGNLTSFKATYCGNFATCTFTGSNSNNTFIDVRIPQTLSVGSAIEIGTVSGTPVGGTTPNLTFANCIVGRSGASTLHNVPFGLAIQGNSLCAKYLGADTISVANILIPLSSFYLDLTNN